VTTPAPRRATLTLVNPAALPEAAPGHRIWQRSGTRAGSVWVLVGEVDEDSVLHGPPIDRVIGTTSHRSKRKPTAHRQRRTGENPGWLWLIRWYRARWSGRRAVRSR
jgi:hypothetical protein